MESELKEFIEKHIDLIDSEDWVALYNKTYAELPLYLVGQLTSTLYNIGIDPLTKLVAIPSGYFCEVSDIPKSLVIPSNIKQICTNAFLSSGFEKVVIPKSVERISPHAFDECASLTEVFFEDGCKMILNNAFEACPSLSNLRLPDTLTHIMSNAFLYCDELNSIELPKSIERISDGAFYHSSPCTITFPPGDIVIGRHIFGPPDSNIYKLGKVYRNSSAEKYCIANNIAVEYLN